MKRIRTLIIIVLIVVSVTPAVIGWLIRHSIHEELSKQGIDSQHIVITPGWLQSSLSFPLNSHNKTDASGLNINLTLQHGPYLLDNQQLAWAGAAGDIRSNQLQLATISANLSLDLHLSAQLQATSGLHQFFPPLSWQEIMLELSAFPTQQQWRASLHLAQLSYPLATQQFNMANGQIDISWQNDANPALNAWANGHELELMPFDGPTSLKIQEFKLNLDWLEQDRFGQLRSQFEAIKLSGADSSVDRIQLAWQAKPLDVQFIHMLPDVLAQTSAGYEHLTLALSPLLAHRPDVILDSFVVNQGDQAIQIEGILSARPGGVHARTQGGGPEDLFLRLSQIFQYSQHENEYLTHGLMAAESLKRIKRQGWLQRHGDELRADIVINY